MPGMQFVYPTSAELTEIDQTLLAQNTLNDPLFQLLKIETTNSDLVEWEQKDNYMGLTQVRGLNGKPASVKRVAGKRFMMEPGVYGEFIPLDELELTRRRRWGTFNQPIDIRDLVMEAQDQLVTRETNRIRWVMWQLLVNGFFQVLGPNGAVLHTDAYAQRIYTAPVPWSTFATASPLGDFTNVQLFGRGYSTSFGSGAIAFANQKTFNNLRSNTNNQDIYGRRTQGLGTYNSLEQINTLLLGDGLPSIKIYDDGYLDETGTFQLLLPDNIVVVIGRRTNNAPIGEFSMTRNLNRADGGGGVYVSVVDETEKPPRNIEVHRGFNGGPKIWYPSSIVVMKV